MPKIEYVTKSWNPISGCAPGLPCWDRCWARRMAKRLAGRCGYPPSPDEFTPTVHPKQLTLPLSWKAPQRVAVGFMGDIALQPRDVLADIMTAARMTPRHRYLWLTKRPCRLRNCLAAFDEPPPDNVWIGVSVSTTAEAMERIPVLLDDIRCAHRWVSAEPLLESIDLSAFGGMGFCGAKDTTYSANFGIGWVVGWIVKRIVIQVCVIFRLGRLLRSFRWGAGFSKADVRYAFYNAIGNVAFLIVFLIFLVALVGGSISRL